MYETNEIELMNDDWTSLKTFLEEVDKYLTANNLTLTNENEYDIVVKKTKDGVILKYDDKIY